MKRFLMLVGVAAVAGAMYVAGASGSHQTKFAPESQVVALQKKVTAITKELKTVKPEADFAASLIASCYIHDNGNGTANFLVLPVSQFGNASSGFLFGTSGTNTPRSALDVVASGPQEYLQEVDPQCATLTLLRRGAMRSSITRLQTWAKHTR